jgi:hypothetical protein
MRKLLVGEQSSKCHCPNPPAPPPSSTGDPPSKKTPSPDEPVSDPLEPVEKLPDVAMRVPLAPVDPAAVPVVPENVPDAPIDPPPVVPEDPPIPESRGAAAGLASPFEPMTTIPDGLPITAFVSGWVYSSFDGVVKRLSAALPGFPLHPVPRLKKADIPNATTIALAP